MSMIHELFVPTTQYFKQVTVIFLVTSSDFIWTDINWTLEALAFILMSVQIRSDMVVKLKTKRKKTLIRHCIVFGHSNYVCPEKMRVVAS